MKDFMDYEKKLKYIILTLIKGVGCVSQNALLDICGNIETCFTLSKEEIHERDTLGKVGEHRIHLVSQGRENKQIRLEAEAILKDSIDKGIAVITREDNEYPKRFLGLGDMPIALYVKGKLKINDTSYSAGVIGARRCTQEGKRTAIETTVKAVNKNGLVVSGMAKGIDSYAHTAALKTNGYTIAVLGNGPDICYPPEHQSLYEELIKRGCILSEYPPGTKARSYMFPLRNRIIAALSDEVFVIEAGRNSGTQTTVENCEKYGRKVVRIT
ncbi:DNA processing protein [Butyrivibrio sp. INlla14]|nr:DNA processing protein [Butyrivibrio sp. INlla14]